MGNNSAQWQEKPCNLQPSVFTNNAYASGDDFATLVPESAMQPEGMESPANVSCDESNHPIGTATKTKKKVSIQVCCFIK
jgi:hypothetical protein